MKRTTSENRMPCARSGQAGAAEGTPRRLPIASIRGRVYYRDDRLQEFRAVDDPGERIPFEVMVWARVILGKWPD